MATGNTLADGQNSNPLDTDIQSPQENLEAEVEAASGGAEKAELTEAVAAPPPATGTARWPGWPGDNVFRLIIPVAKVGSIIGRKGELVKKMCDETRARIRILDGPLGTPDRIVLISGKEELDAKLSPAMEAVLRVFKRVTGLSTMEGDGIDSAAAAAFCSMKMLVASSQGISLIGRKGSIIKLMQESSGASMRILSEDEVPYYATSDERIVEIHGESIQVLKALEAVLGHLRKFLVDRSVIPIFEKTHNATISQDRAVDSWADKAQSMHQPARAPPKGIGSDYSISLNRDPLAYDHEDQLDSKIQQSGFSLYGQDTGHGGLGSTGLGRTGGPIVTQMTQTMQIPISYAEDIIGIGGANIAYIRRSSGAVLTIQESRGLPDEIIVEIKGTASQVQMAQQLIQEFISSHKEPPSYGRFEAGLSSYSHLSDSAYPSSYSSQLGGYGSSGVGGYSSFRF